MATNSSRNTSSVPLDMFSVHAWFAVSISVSVVSSCILLLLITASLCQEELRTGSRLLIVHLMIIQLLLCGFYTPFLNITTYRALLGHPLTIYCPTLLWFQISTQYAENWATVLLAVNRCVAIGFPHKYHQWITRNALVAMMVPPWAIAGVITLPAFCGVDGVEFRISLTYGFCTTISHGGPYVTAWVTFGAYISMAVIGVLYVGLFASLAYRRQMTRLVVSDVNMCPRTRRSRLKQVGLAKILMVSFCWYCLCYLPGPIILTTFPTWYLRDVMLQLWVARLLTLCGYAASPIFFLLLSSDYRNGLLQLMNRVFRLGDHGH